ncbi:MAG: hypothetical protein NXH70_02150 [Hyphomonas sp.]|nr:hypothetical protein [Hyphomonas sp.]
MIGYRVRGITSPESEANAIAAKRKYGGYGAAASALVKSNFVAERKKAKSLLRGCYGFSVNAYTSKHSPSGVRYTDPITFRGKRHTSRFLYRINVKPKRKQR